MTRLISPVTTDRVLTARYPNPFQGVNGAVAFDRSSEQELVIVDGGKLLKRDWPDAFENNVFFGPSICVQARTAKIYLSIRSWLLRDRWM